MRFSSQRGFTLVEAVVVIGIAVVLTGILTVYTRNSEKQIVFMKEQSLLVSSLLRAKAFSLETFQTGLNPGLEPSGEKICGWGVHFDRNAGQYSIFRDLPQSGNCEVNPKYDSGEDFEIFNLDRRSEIACLALNQNVSGTCNIGGPASVDVIFIPPDPITKFHPPGLGLKEAVIVLKLNDGSREATIRVNNFGQITF